MNAPTPNSADEENIAIDILFEDHPEIRAFLDSMNDGKIQRIDGQMRK